jgi:hypothetical protein
MIEFHAGGRILALDPASTTGFAYGAPDADAPEIGSVKFSREHDVRADVFGRAVAWWRMRMQTRAPHLLVIEPPIPPGDLWGRSNYDRPACHLRDGTLRRRHGRGENTPFKQHL